MAEHLDELARLAERQVGPADDPVGEVASDPSAVRYIHGLTAISETIDEKLDRAREEILTAQPDGPRPGPVLKSALEAVRRQISAGIAMRTLHQHTTRFDEATKEYVRAVTDRGAKVRTLDEFFDRLIIIDTSVAFISANEDRTTAVAITEPAVVRFLKDTFERAWDRASPFPFVPVHAAKAAGEVMPAIRESIGRLLVEGHSDKRITRRMGISERSLQAHIAAMKQELGAHNRLQLGYLLGRSDTTYIF
ncbi:LuxR C-terminal-related transcriptional regulator [Streptomyces sp. B1866]|uniref:LuxR C-terminal-related transcriptional regulator n=1 Tax=Streptomyces sp. B1866 TaxID=3075431 RepID=UPI00288D67D4|nr:LuxR C-terminal-related transcriptional regulator [Streptomyces sp. B1866]MDT3395179.1 LuxR C-terminal-related transcriptional regulator [Streptomyces sp. B1866]